MKATFISAQKSIQLTPECLYKKGKESYQQALVEEVIFTQQKLYTNAILYFQGAMFLGSEDACAYLSEFYKNGNHLGINNERLNNLIKIVANIGKFLHYSKLTNSMCLKGFGISDYSELMELAIIEKGYMNAVQGEWHKIPVPEYLSLTNLKTIIQEFNSELPPEYQLITDESIFEHKEEIRKKEIKDSIDEEEINKELNEFTPLTQSESILDITTVQSQPITLEPIEEYRENTKHDYSTLLGAGNCTIS
ncbi:MAG: hypothetical protein LN590_06425 [Rickettsia endosymbiont of Glossina mortisans submortisans]|nr:hypothetical protein [Rickettsia endosymbiont of Glossina mortisans submortisans]